MTNSEETYNNQSLIAAHRDRLKILELQAARQGDDTPPHVVNEIQKIVATISALDTVNRLTPADIMPPGGSVQDNRRAGERRRNASTNEQATLRMIATVQATVAEVSNVKTDLRERISEVRQDVRDQLTGIQDNVRDQLAGVQSNVDSQIGAVQDQLVALQQSFNLTATTTQNSINGFIRNFLLGVGVFAISVAVIAFVLWILYG